jgi:hypothetical protein
MHHDAVTAELPGTLGGLRATGSDTAWHNHHPQP